MIQANVIYKVCHRQKGEEPLAEAVSGPSGHQESHTHVDKSLHTLCTHDVCLHVHVCICKHVSCLPGPRSHRHLH